MKRVSFAPFGNLINSATRVKDEFDKDVEAISSPVVKKALETQKAREDEAIQAEILEALTLLKERRGQKVQSIRNLRKQVDVQLGELKKLDKAEEIALQKGDFRPLLSALGFRIDGFEAAE